MAEAITWEPKRAALRDLVLLALHRRAGSIKSERGRVSSALREDCSVPESATNRKCVSDVLRGMEQDGLVSKTTVAKRTFAVALVRPLSEEEVIRLEAAEMANRAFFIELSTADAGTPAEVGVTAEQIIDKLAADCEKAYQALCKAADTAERETSQGRVAINGPEVLTAVGIRSNRAKEVRYYLAQFGLAKAVKPHEHISSLWWWEVSRQPLDTERLRRMASGERSYENHRAHTRRPALPEDGPRERAFAGRTPSVLPDYLCGPVTVRHVKPPVAAEPEPVVATEQAQPISDADRIDALIGIIERLERESRELQDTVDRLEGEKSELQTAVNELRAELEQRAVTTDRADAVIARYSAP